MPRQSTTPVTAKANSAFHADQSEAAIATIREILDGKSKLPADKQAEALHAAAKVLEAAGCYIRRQNSKGLLTP